MNSLNGTFKIHKTWFSAFFKLKAVKHYLSFSPSVIIPTCLLQAHAVLIDPISMSDLFQSLFNFQRSWELKTGYLIY